jgi:predicted DNA-binding protein
MHLTQIDPATAANLHTLASLTGRPEPELLRAAVAAYLEDFEDLRAAAESLRELEAGAKPLSLRELDEYLNRGVDG